MNTKMLIKCLLATAAISAAFPAPVNGDIVPALWGVADKHVPLLSFSHYTAPFDTFTDFGRLQLWNDDHFKNGEPLLEAFPGSPGDFACISINDELGGLDDAVLLSLDLYSTTTGGSHGLDFDRQFTLELARKRDRVAGLRFDLVGGDLYALFRDHGKRPATGLGWLMN